MRAYLTPDTPTGEFACRSLSIPVEMLHIVTGALEILTNEWAYEEHGTMSPQDAAAAMLEMLNTYKQSEGICVNRVGEIVLFAGSPPVQDMYLLCDGSTYDRVDYPLLWDYVSVSTNWTFDADTFTVPNLLYKFLRMSDEVLSEGGEDTHVLTTAQMPVHSHTVHTHGAGLALAPGELPVTIPSVGAGVTGNAGSGQAHNNMPSYIDLIPSVIAR